MAIRLVAVDLDGTLFDEEKRISPETKAAVARAAERGVYVAICTGRMLSECDRVLEALPQIRYAVTTSGARVVDLQTGRTLGGCCMTADRVRQIVADLWEFPAIITVMADGQVWCDAEVKARTVRTFSGWMVDYVNAYYRGVDLRAWIQELDKPVEKVFTIFWEKELNNKALARFLPQEDLYVATSSPYNLELTAKDADKGKGLDILARHLGLMPGEVMAIGDSDNDRKMLEYAGCAVVMGNGEESVMPLADFVAPTNNDHGVAWVLDHLDEEGYPWS